MTGADQVAVIYCGVKGYLDEMPTSKITEFEEAFTKHFLATQEGLRNEINKTGVLSAESEEKLKTCITSFLSSFT